jgi:hypothetical protein
MRDSYSKLKEYIEKNINQNSNKIFISKIFQNISRFNSCKLSSIHITMYVRFQISPHPLILRQERVSNPLKKLKKPLGLSLHHKKKFYL